MTGLLSYGQVSLEADGIPAFKASEAGIECHLTW